MKINMKIKLTAKEMTVNGIVMPVGATKKDLGDFLKEFLFGKES